MRLFHLDLRFIAGVAGQSATTQPQLRDSPPPAPFPLLSPPSSATTLCFSTRTFHMVHLQAYCTAKYLRCPAPIAPALTVLITSTFRDGHNLVTSHGRPRTVHLQTPPSCQVHPNIVRWILQHSARPRPFRVTPPPPTLCPPPHPSARTTIIFCNTGRSAITKKLHTCLCGALSGEGKHRRTTVQGKDRGCMFCSTCKRLPDFGLRFITSMLCCPKQLLVGGRPAVGPDGRPVLPEGQRAGRQPPRRSGVGDHPRRPDAPVLVQRRRRTCRRGLRRRAEAEAGRSQDKTARRRSLFVQPRRHPRHRRLGRLGLPFLSCSCRRDRRPSGNRHAPFRCIGRPPLANQNLIAAPHPATLLSPHIVP